MKISIGEKIDLEAITTSVPNNLKGTGIEIPSVVIEEEKEAPAPEKVE